MSNPSRQKKVAPHPPLWMLKGKKEKRSDSWCSLTPCRGRVLVNWDQVGLLLQLLSPSLLRAGCYVFSKRAKQGEIFLFLLEAALKISRDDCQQRQLLAHMKNYAKTKRMRNQKELADTNKTSIGRAWKEVRYACNELWGRFDICTPSDHFYRSIPILVSL